MIPFCNYRCWPLLLNCSNLRYFLGYLFEIQGLRLRFIPKKTNFG